MFTRVFEVLVPVCLATSLVSAQSPFMGAWKLDPSRSRLPDEMKVQSKGGNRYSFDFGGGPETVMLDGSEQPGIDSTLLSVKAAGPHTWIVRRTKRGRVLLTATWKLSHHDSTLTDAFRGFQADGSVLSMDYVYQRTGEGSGIAADWHSIKETMNSPFLLEVKAFQGDGFSFVSPLGTTNVKFGDQEHPQDDPGAGGGASRSIRRVDDRTLKITITQGGREAATEEIALSTDLKTLTMTVRVVGRSRPNVLVFERK